MVQVLRGPYEEQQRQVQWLSSLLCVDFNFSHAAPCIIVLISPQSCVAGFA
jgi:hypothetical protein